LAILDRALVRLLPAVPRTVVRRIADRYIAGEELGDAVETVARLNAGGRTATIDVLGEEVARREEVREITRAYLDASRRSASGASTRTSASSPPGWVCCSGTTSRARTSRRSSAARPRSGTSSASTWRTPRRPDDTLRIYRELRDDGLDNVGVVLQARLRRTLEDIEALAELRPNIRICKGIYLEPEEIAFTGFEEIRLNYVRCLEALDSAASFVGVATHDEFLISEAKRVMQEPYEFQMLLGVREPLGDQLVRDGARLRIYVPYGRQWYEYSLRRLQENPRIAGYVATDTVGRILGRNGSA
jgi:proline dehydrogenase